MWLFRSTSTRERDLLESIRNRDVTKCKSILKQIQPQELSQFRYVSNNNSSTILHFTIDSFIENYDWNLEILEAIIIHLGKGSANLMAQSDEFGRTIWHKVNYFRSETVWLKLLDLVKPSAEIFEKTDQHGNTIWHGVANDQSETVWLKLLDLVKPSAEIFEKTDQDGNTVWHLVADRQFETVWLRLLDLVKPSAEIFEKTDQYGNTVWHKVARFQSEIVWVKLLDLVKPSSAAFGKTNKDGLTVWHEINLKFNPYLYINGKEVRPKVHFKPEIIWLKLLELIQPSAEIFDKATNGGWTVWHSVADHYDLSKAVWPKLLDLLKPSVEVFGKTNKDGWTVWHTAIRRLSPEIVLRLIELYPSSFNDNISKTTNTGWSLFDAVVCYQSPVVTLKLIEIVGEKTTKTLINQFAQNHSSTDLVMWIKKLQKPEYQAVTLALLDFPPYVNDSKVKIELVHLAAQADSRFLLNKCEKMGISFHSRDEKHKMPIHTAMQFGSAHAMAWLLERGSLIAKDLQKLQDQDKNTPLHLALLNNQFKIGDPFLDYCNQRDLNELLSLSNSQDQLPLTLAVIHNQPKLVIKLVLMQPNTIDALDADGHDALQQAIKKGHLEVLKELLQQFPERIHRQDKSGNSLLHLTVQCGHSEILQYLISNGIDWKLKNRQDQTALKIAKVSHPEMEGYLKNAIKAQKEQRFRKELQERLGPEPFCFQQQHAVNYVNAVQNCRKAKAIQLQGNKTDDINSLYYQALELLKALQPTDDNPWYGFDSLLLKSYCYLQLRQETNAFECLDRCLERKELLTQDDFKVRLAEVYYWKGFVLRQFLGRNTSGSIKTSLMAALHYFTLAVQILAGVGEYQKQLKQVTERLNQVVSAEVVELCTGVEKVNLSKQDWGAAIAKALEQDRLFTDRIQASPDELLVLAQLIWKNLESDYRKSPALKYQDCLSLAKNNIVNLALQKWDEAYQAFLQTRLNQNVSVQLKTEFNPTLLSTKNLSLQSKSAELVQPSVLFVPVFKNISASDLNLYQELFIEKLMLILQQTYRLYSVLNERLAEKKHEGFNSFIHHVDKTKLVGGYFVGLTAYVAFEVFIAASKQIYDWKFSRAHQLFCELINEKTKDELFNSVAKEIAEMYKKQLCQLTLQGIETLASCVAARIIQYVCSEQGKFSHWQGELGYRLFAKPFKNLMELLTNKTMRFVLPMGWWPDKDKERSQPLQILLTGVFLGVAEAKSEYGTFLETRSGVTTYERPWYAESLLNKTGIVTVDGDYYANYDCDIEKYGFRSGTVEQAKELNMQKLQLNKSAAQLLTDQGIFKEKDSSENSNKDAIAPMSSSNQNPVMSLNK